MLCSDGRRVTIGMEHKKLLIFDFDGVIIDSMQLAFTNAASVHPSLTWEMYQNVTHKKTPAEARKEYEHLHIDETKEEKEERTKKYTITKLEKAQVHSGMKEVLKMLGDEYILALNTNSGKERTIPLLEKHNLKKFFKIILTIEDAQSKTEKSENIMSELGIDPANAIYITDATSDVMEAEEAGMQSIGVTWGIHERRHFKDSEISDSVIDVVDSPDELLDSIKDHFS